MNFTHYAKVGKEQIHIGKSSYGWTFCFHATDTIKSYKEWLIFLINNDAKIIDEYDKEVHLSEFAVLVDSKRDAKRNHAREFSHDDGSYLDPDGNSMSPGEFSWVWLIMFECKCGKQMNSIGDIYYSDRFRCTNCGTWWKIVKGWLKWDGEVIY